MKQIQILFALTLLFSAGGCSQGSESQSAQSSEEIRATHASFSSTGTRESNELLIPPGSGRPQPRTIQKIDGYEEFLSLWANPQLATQFFHSYYYGGDKRLALKFERSSPGARYLRITRWWNEYHTPFDFKPNTPSGNMLDSISVDDIEVIGHTLKQLTLAFISHSGDVQREVWGRYRNVPSYVARFEYTTAWRYKNVHEVMTFPLNQEGKIDPKPAAAFSRGSGIPENSAVAMAYRTTNTYRNSDMPDTLFFNFNSCDELTYSNLNLKMASYEKPLYCFVPESASHWAFLAPESQISETLELQAEADLKAREDTPCGKTEYALTSAYSAAEKLHYKIQSSMLYGPRLPEIDYFSLVERFSREKKELLTRFDSMAYTCKSQIDTYARRMDALLGEFKADEDMARRIWGQ